MRFMMLIIPRAYQPGAPGGQRASEAFTPSVEAVTRMMKFNEELNEAGALISLDGLHPTSRGARITFGGGKPKVSKGPFTEAKEVVGGYWVIRANSLEDAIDWARKVPAENGDAIEVRQIFEMSEFPPDVQKAVEGSSIGAQGRKERG